MPSAAARILAFASSALLWSYAARAQGSIEITLKHDTANEAATRAQLQRLLGQYDVTPWLFTTAVVVDEGAIPFSHPVLTLHTRHAKDDELLLSTFVHEQLHWWLEAQKDATAKAVTDLRTLFPKVPVGGVEGGRDEPSTYVHLIVGFLERQAVVRLLGELQAKQVMDFWAQDHYTWIYRQVLDRGAEIGRIVRDRGLTPRR